MPGKEYQIKEVEKGDETKVSDLIWSAFDVRRSGEFFDWRLRRNPAGTPFTQVALIGDRAVGMAGGVPQLMKVGDEEVPICSTGDAIAEEEFKKTGLYLRLARTGIRSAQKEGIQIFIGGANEVSKKVNYVLGFRSVGRIHHMTLPLDVTPYVLRKIPFRPLAGIIACVINLALRLHRFRPHARPDSVVVKEVERFDQRFDRLWDSVKSSIPVTNVRSSTFLNWRYIDSPMKHHVLAVEDAQSGDVRGYAALKMDPENDKKIGLLMDCFCSPEEPAVLNLLLDEAIRFFRQNGCSTLRAWGIKGMGLFGRLVRRGFIVRESPFYFIVRPSRGNETLLLDPQNWHLLQGDTDHVGLSE